MIEKAASFTVSPDHAIDVNINDVISEIKYIPLVLPDDVLLREIITVIFDQESFFLLDMGAYDGASPIIFSFDLNGTFMYAIDYHGQGPGEFETIYDIDITESSVVLSTPTELKYYDKKTGEYVKSIESPLSTMQIISMINDSTMVIDAGRFRANQSMEQVKIYNLHNGDVIYSGIPFDNHTLKLGHTHRYFYRYNGDLYAVPMYNHVVYRLLSEDGAQTYDLDPVYFFDFGARWIPNSILANSYNDRKSFFNSYSEYVHTIDIFETNQILYLCYNLDGLTFRFLFGKENSRSENIKSYSENSIGWVNCPVTTHDDWIVNIATELDLTSFDIIPDQTLSSLLEETDVVLVLSKFDLR